jgi:hypothetical protein
MNEATITKVMHGASFLKQLVFFPELLGPNCISVAELIEQGFTITFGEGEIRVYGPEQEAYMIIRIDNKGYHAIPLEQFLPFYQEFYSLSSDQDHEHDEYTSHDDEVEPPAPLPPPPPLPNVPSPVRAPWRPIMTRSRTKAATYNSSSNRTRSSQSKTDIELADVLSVAEHALLRKSSLIRRQQTANIDDNLGRRPQKRAKPGLLQVADAPKISTRIVAEALSPDTESGDMESSEVESDHIDHSGTPPTSPYTNKDFEKYTWTQPSSPRPPLAAPPVPPAVPAPNELTLPGTTYFAAYATSAPASHKVKLEPGLVPDSDDNDQDRDVNSKAVSLHDDSDYGAGLSSASDDDDYERDTSDERLLHAKKLDLIMTTVSAYKTQKDPEQHSQQADMPELLENSINTNKQAQACRPKVDGQSTARHHNASKADDHNASKTDD